MNGRLKQFAVLTTHFRHMGKNAEDMMQKHKLCFHAVAVVTQLKFDAGEKTFDVVYNVNYHDPGGINGTNHQIAENT